MKRAWLAAGVLCLFGACGGDSGTNPDPDPGGGGPTGGGRVIKANPSFDTDIQEIFNRMGCASSSCHGTSESAGLRLTAGDSYDELVNIAAFQEPGTRVIPNDAENSYLVIKIEGRQTVGGKMPVGGSLDNIDITNIRNWIDTGALNN